MIFLSNIYEHNLYSLLIYFKIKKHKFLYILNNNILF